MTLPGVEKPKRFRPRFHWELIACGFTGHELVGMEAKTVRPVDALVVRELDGYRWHRCLRCDSWVPLRPPKSPTRDHPPGRDEIALPLRGRPLRDKFVLRLIAVDRALHFVVLGLLSLAVFDLARRHSHFRALYERVLAALQGGLGGPNGATSSQHGLVAELSRVFSYSNSRLYVTGTVLAIYAILEAVEMVGLWMMKRWAEYLTFIVTASLLPLEIYEIFARVSLIKLTAFAVNVAVVYYLIYAKRLFGFRGGAAAVQAQRDRDVGWESLERNSPRAP